MKRTRIRHVAVVFANLICASAMADTLADATDDCVSLSSLAPPAVFGGSLEIESVSSRGPGKARFDYWWARCTKAQHKHFHDYALAFRVTAISGSYANLGNYYVRQAGLTWSVNSVVSSGPGGTTLNATGPYSTDYGVISNRTMGFSPGNNPDPSKPISICGSGCDKAVVTIQPPAALAGNAATFDANSGTLTVPMVWVGQEAYATVFTMTSANPIAFTLKSAAPLQQR